MTAKNKLYKVKGNPTYNKFPIAPCFARLDDHRFRVIDHFKTNAPNPSIYAIVNLSSLFRSKEHFEKYARLTPNDIKHYEVKDAQCYCSK